jgi:hypothetical protein
MNQPGNPIPTSVKEAVDRLMLELSFKDKARIANMAEGDLIDLQFSLGEDIKYRFYLWSNTYLLESCRAVSGEDDVYATEACCIIIRELWKKLQETHKMRLVQ